MFSIVNKYRICLAFLPLICSSLADSDIMFKIGEKNNIPIVKHTVTTPDGYILALYNIPPAEKTDDTKVIFMMHGLTSLSSQYLLYPNESAGFFFHEHGYDVWLGNGRGNTLSRNHTTLDPDQNEFWNFSWHEIGSIDMPAMIDYILEQTKKKQLICYGHSQGAATQLVLLSERPEYNDKISSIQLIGTSAVTKELSLSLQWPKFNVDVVEMAAELFGVFEVLPNRHCGEMIKLVGEFCSDSFFSGICKLAIAFPTELTCGPFNENSFSKTLIADAADVGFPAGASYRQFIHYLQCLRAGVFQKYDYGSEKNLKVYGSEDPPEYSLSNIRTKVYMLYGTEDYLAPESNVHYFTEKMRNAKQIRVENVNLSHYDLLLPPHTRRVNKMVHNAIERFEEDFEE